MCNAEAVSLRSMCSFITSLGRSYKHKSISGVRYNVGRAESSTKFRLEIRAGSRQRIEQINKAGRVKVGRQSSFSNG